MVTAEGRWTLPGERGGLNQGDGGMPTIDARGRGAKAGYSPCVSADDEKGGMGHSPCRGGGLSLWAYASLEVGRGLRRN